PGTVPSWVFRPWASANEWNTQARVEAEIGRSLDEGIRVGVVVIEAWSDEATFTIFRDAQYTPRADAAPMCLGDFTFPHDGAWPDPVRMVEWLHERGVKVLLWQIPLLPVEVPADRHGAEQLAHDRRVLVDEGYAVHEADGQPYANRGWWFPGAFVPDFTSADATAWWLAKRRYLVDELGIDGFKTDGGEHAWGDELRWADGTRGDVTNNRFPNLYAQAYHQLLGECERDGVTFSRAGFTGAGATPCHWAGDEDSTWEAFRASILAGLSAGVSGVFAWGFDHGGFSGEIPSAELYLRSAAMATLCPIMQYHAEYNHHQQPSNDRTPWNIAARHDAAEVVETYRAFTELRDRLVGYLDQQYHAGIASGRPLMRPLSLHWPRDPRVWRFPYQYLLGDHLLVAPVTEPGLERIEVYLPNGSWVDVWDGTELEGGRTHTVDAPIDRIPVFALTHQAASLRGIFTG
ncbi:MAG: TIM-barrel domain-containing protein, partial [Actinomycetota bacterium]